MTRADFNDHIFSLCAKHNCSQTSGYRTSKRNEAVGGSPNSLHLLGLGVDIVPDVNHKSVKEAILRDARRLGLFGLDEGDHVHLQSAPPL